MINFNSSTPHSSIKLVDAFKINTKEELKDISKLLRISVSSKLRKEEYSATLARKVLSNPEAWLSRLTYYELTLLQKLVHAGPENFVEEPDFLIESTLEYLSLVFVDRSFSMDEGKVRYIICDELRESIAPHLDKVLATEEQTSHFMIEQYANGILNLYGCLHYEVFNNILCEYLHDILPKATILETVASSMLIQGNTFSMIGRYGANTYIKSTLLLEPARLEDDLYQHRHIKKLKRFTKEEVFAMGEMPIFNIPCACSDKLKIYMTKDLGLSEEAAASLMIDLWYSMQIDTDPMSAIASVIENKFSSIQELQKIVELFMNYCNQCPCWFLKGHSPMEISTLFGGNKLKKAPPRLIAGLDMKASSMDMALDTQTQFDKMFYTFLGQNIGRNDPCPCGSGKKYKNCCGREN